MRIRRRRHPTPKIDVAPALGRSSQDALGSRDTPDTNLAGRYDPDERGDVSTTGRGPTRQRLRFISMLARQYK